MLNITQPYEPRPIRFLELWKFDDWRMKVYGIAHGKPAPRGELIEAAKVVAQRTLTSLANATSHYSVGFLGIHDGRTGNFVFVDWWADENELNHHVYNSPNDDPTQLKDISGSGPAACVWDLRVMAFERDAWLDCILKNPHPDVEAYLQRQLSEDV
jgi:hypothetical protein